MSASWRDLHQTHITHMHWILRQALGQMHIINKELCAKCHTNKRLQLFVYFKSLQVYIPCRVAPQQTVHSKTQTNVKRLNSTHAVCTFLPKAVALTTVRSLGTVTATRIDRDSRFFFPPTSRQLAAHLDRWLRLASPLRSSWHPAVIDPTRTWSYGPPASRTRLPLTGKLAGSGSPGRAGTIVTKPVTVQRRRTAPLPSCCPVHCSQVQQDLK